MFNVTNELLLMSMFLAFGIFFGIIFYFSLKIKNKILNIVCQVALAACVCFAFFLLIQTFNYGIFRVYMLIFFIIGTGLSFGLFAKAVKLCYNIKQRIKNESSKNKINS